MPEQPAPCPFCGGTSSRYVQWSKQSEDGEWWMVQWVCNSCKAHGPEPFTSEADHDKAKSHAIRGWNQRYKPPTRWQRFWETVRAYTADQEPRF